MLNGTTSNQSSGPASVISDDTLGQILSQEHDSAPCDTDVATGSIEELQAGEAPTKTESVSIVRYDISTRAFVIIFIAISVQSILLLFFKNYL